MKGEVVHTIRLNGFWEASEDGASFTRSFGRPSQIADGESIWLTVSSQIDGLAINSKVMKFEMKNGVTYVELLELELRNRVEIFTKKLGDVILQIYRRRD